MQKQNLTRASNALFERRPDERFESLDALMRHCEEDKARSMELWQAPKDVTPVAEPHSLGLRFGSSRFRLNDWSFSQVCRLANVSKDTVNKLSPETAGLVLRETLPVTGKPLQAWVENDLIRSIHGASYTRLFNADLLSVVLESAPEFTLPQRGMNGGTGLYCGEQDLFVFLIDPTGWAEIEGEAFAPGFFLWNSEVGRRSVGVETFWFQAVCQNHIVWDAVEVSTLTRKHTASTIANTMRRLRPIAACWQEARPFSLSEWLEKGESVVVLAGKPGEVGLETINRVFCKMLSAKLLKGPESALNSRFWLFCDELRYAGRLDALSDILNARSKGVRVALGFQEMSALVEAYGSRDRVRSIINNCASVSWLKLECEETAEWASKRVGQFEQFEYLTARSKDGTTVSEHLSKREAMLPSEFMQQPSYRDDTVTGIHILHSVQGVFKSSSKYPPFTGDPSRNFIAREEAKKHLIPLTPNDVERLGVGLEPGGDDDDGSSTVAGPSGPRGKGGPGTGSGGVSLDDLDRLEF